MATKAVGDVLHRLGHRDSKLPNRIISIHDIDPDQLDFQQLVSVYQGRSLRDGVIMHLIQVGAFWLDRTQSAISQKDRDEAHEFLNVVVDATTGLAQQEWRKETNHRELILKQIVSMSRSGVPIARYERT
jgi:hypothetical protein